jgi:hypothetical protein
MAQRVVDRRANSIDIDMDVIDLTVESRSVSVVGSVGSPDSEVEEQSEVDDVEIQEEEDELHADEDDEVDFGHAFRRQAWAGLEHLLDS